MITFKTTNATTQVLSSILKLTSTENNVTLTLYFFIIPYNARHTILNKPSDTPPILRTNPTDDLCSTHTPYLILTRFEFLLFLVTFDNVG